MKDNGKTEQTPLIMQNSEEGREIAKELRNELRNTSRTQDLSRYYVMEGMQNEEKKAFFTEYTKFDDVLRMNTIEMYMILAPKIIRKSNQKTRDNIDKLLQDVFKGHVDTHKRNMASLNRKREQAYINILRGESEIINQSPRAIDRLLGMGKRRTI